MGLIITSKPEQRDFFIQPKPQAQSFCELEFDGGCKPNPGLRYGSWLARLNGTLLSRDKNPDFGYGTCNEAEFMALEEGLRETLLILENKGIDPSTVNILAWTDSNVVYCKLSPRFKHKSGLPGTDRARMDKYASYCRFMLKQFADYDIKRRDRIHNVATFGH